MRKVKSQSNLQRCVFNLPVDAIDQLKSIRDVLGLPTQTAAVQWLIGEYHKKMKIDEHKKRAMDMIENLEFSLSKKEKKS